jgi:hypothetical protein
VNRSAINWRMVPVLVGLLVVALALMPGEVGELFGRFGHVAADGARQMHDGYMRLFH